MATSPIILSLNTLKLRENNPYSIGEIINFSDLSPSMLVRTPIDYTPNFLDRYYRVAKGDNLSNIAYLAYGDSKLWWLIADANKVMNPLDLAPDLELVIPPIQVLNSL